MSNEEGRNSPPEDKNGGRDLIEKGNRHLEPDRTTPDRDYAGPPPPPPPPPPPQEE